MKHVMAGAGLALTRATAHAVNDLVSGPRALRRFRNEAVTVAGKLRSHSRTAHFASLANGRPVILASIRRTRSSTAMRSACPAANRPQATFMEIEHR